MPILLQSTPCTLGASMQRCINCFVLSLLVFVPTAVEAQDLVGHIYRLERPAVASWPPSFTRLSIELDRELRVRPEQAPAGGLSIRAPDCSGCAPVEGGALALRDQKTGAASRIEPGQTVIVISRGGTIIETLPFNLADPSSIDRIRQGMDSASPR